MEKDTPPLESETVAEEMNSENLHVSGEGLHDTGKLKSVGTRKEVFQPASDGKFKMNSNIIFKHCMQVTHICYCVISTDLLDYL